MTTETTIQRPADLDPTKLHTPAEYRKWKSDVADYHAAIREEQNRERRKEEAKAAHKNRILTDDENYALAVERLAEQQKREAERKAVRQAEQDAKAAYLASRPDVAEVLERSDFHFLLAVVHWANKGYALSANGVDAFLPGFYSCRLDKPVTAKQAK